MSGIFPTVYKCKDTVDSLWTTFNTSSHITLRDQNLDTVVEDVNDSLSEFQSLSASRALDYQQHTDSNFSESDWLINLTSYDDLVIL